MTTGTRPIPNRAPRRSRRIGLLLVLLLTAIGVVRIVTTYPVFSQAWDESAHLATGMEWLDHGTYQREPLHPPLARVMIALGPYIDGVRSPNRADTWDEGNELLHDRGRYQHNLTLARLGILPFFVLATIVAYLWGRLLYGESGGVIAAALFTTLPPILGHAGIATTDMAVTATVALALYAWWRWLDQPTTGWSIGLGAAVGLAVLSKLSALVFLPAAGLALLWCHRVAARSRASRYSKAERLRASRFAYVSMIIVVWAGYRFSVGPLIAADDVALEQRSAAFGPYAQLYRAGYRVARAEVYPAPEFFQGLAMLYQKNAAGHKAYLLGTVRTTGWWYFFPVALAVKTPLGLLALLLIGMGVIGRDPDRARRWTRAGPLLAAGAMVVICMPSSINIGLRHILPVYPLVAVTAGGAMISLWDPSKQGRGRWGIRVLVVGLAAYHIGASVSAHPDYVAYFNPVAGHHPENVLVDSDLDNAMDLKRLADTLRALHVPQLSITYAGSADLTRHGLPPFHVLEPYEQTTGWVAASLYSIKLGLINKGLPGGFSWLEAYEPFAFVGHSIRLYRIPEHGSRPE